MTLTLRPYQAEAVAAVYAHLQKHDNNPCVEIPTAGGKSAIIATIASDAVNLWGGKVMIAAHVKELLEQNAAELLEVAPELEGKIGIFSAGLGEKDPHKPITVAGVQSAYRHPNRFGKVDLVLVDEAHLIPVEGEGMYRTLIAGLREINPALRVVGFTATPYRMSSGLICHPNNILNRICYGAEVQDLMRQGFLCKLITASVREPDTSGWRVTAGEFNSADAENDMADIERVKQACEDLWALVNEVPQRHSVLVFTQGKIHAARVVEQLTRLAGVGTVGLITADTDAEERALLIDLFREGRLRFLVNINVLTTGFNAKNVDCVAILRATMSPGLWYQMCGRGFRIHPEKTDCLILDYGGNAIRHGPVDAIETFEQKAQRELGQAPWKVCDVCLTVVPAGTMMCPTCGFVWPPRKTNHDEMAGTTAVLSGQAKVSQHPVKKVIYAKHEKRAKLGEPIPPPTMRVEYILGDLSSMSEWICFEHQGYAREKACLWWARRAYAPIPRSIDEALEVAAAGGLAEPTEITVREVSGEKYARVIGYKLGERRQGTLTAAPKEANHEPA